MDLGFISVTMKSISKYLNICKPTDEMKVLSLSKAWCPYIRVQKHLEYICDVQCQAFFLSLYAFCHLPIKDEKLVPPPPLLHGLCPFVLSHKGSSSASVVLCAYTSLQIPHIVHAYVQKSLILVLIKLKEDRLPQSGVMYVRWLSFKAFFFFLNFFVCFFLFGS